MTVPPSGAGVRCRIRWRQRSSLASEWTVVVDMQHGVAPYSDLIAKAIGNSEVTPLVRMPIGDFGVSQRALDAGAQGIIVPLVDDATWLRAGYSRELAIAHGNYPPISSGSTRRSRSMEETRWSR